MVGIVALDLDGTVVEGSRPISEEVISYLQGLTDAGWRLIFITGRTFYASQKTLKGLPFPYHVAVQNGALILEMPSGVIISKKYVDDRVFPVMEKICADEPTDFVLYTGHEFGDQCFFRSDRFDKRMLNYVSRRCAGYREDWTEVSSYDSVPIRQYASVKCFGAHDSALRIGQRIERELGLHVPIIRDPFCEGFYVAQATHSEVSKGYALSEFINIVGRIGPVIAAGDDVNDQPMLAVADCKIVMASAPPLVLAMGDVIAPPAAEDGILTGLKQAMQKVGVGQC